MKRLIGDLFIFSFLVSGFVFLYNKQKILAAKQKLLLLLLYLVR